MTPNSRGGQTSKIGTNTAVFSPATNDTGIGIFKMPGSQNHEESAAELVADLCRGEYAFLDLPIAIACSRADCA